MNQDQSKWNNVPGVMQLIEEGIEPDNLSNREFIAPGVRGPEEIEKLKAMWTWLRGFRKDQCLCERLPIWVPIALLWPAPGGTVKFSYETSVETEASAEITLCSVIGFGSGSQLKLTHSVTLNTKNKGLSYLTRAYLTIYRYRHRSSGEEMDRVDVDCKGDYAEFDRQELDPASHPFSFLPVSLSDIKDKGFTLSRVERCSHSTAETVITLGQESLRNWKFKLTPNIPLLELPLSLAISCQRAKSFSTEFSLLAGRDYAFCTQRGESPIVPICVVLK
jgi:hypothetical protein